VCVCVCLCVVCCFTTVVWNCMIASPVAYRIVTFVVCFKTDNADATSSLQPLYTVSMYRVVQKLRTGLVFASNVVKSQPICKILSLFKKINCQRKSHNAFRHTLDMLLHYSVKFKYDANLEIKWKWKRTDFACTEVCSIFTYCWLTYYLIFLVPVKYSLKYQIFYLNKPKC